jgi:hypothetical protein
MKKGGAANCVPDRVRPVDNSVCHEECSCKDACELAKLRRHPQLPSQA